ncbi:hypothetical protein CFAM422_011024 [Trichoderma lentiforme]|uniref:Retrotransposon gag domain-containing protein n=1 Tax=Trichoderma lentiforme TaxID=1567552 RepID=A0A9P4X6L0_9HYPO|nr:hypothetical protein CFAM422_011024 [Trichoderma lentiforme]
MVAETPQDGLLKLWESIPQELRPSGSYTFDALSGTVASLVAKAQESSSSQCEHKNELAKALGKKTDIRNWAAMNGAVPGDMLATAVLQNTTGPAKKWTLSKKIGQYSKTDGVPVSSAATLEAILKDMDNLFKDPLARWRTLTKYQNARQGTRPVLEYNIYFHNLVAELGYDPEPSSSVVYDYIRSLRPGVRERVGDWHLLKTRRDQDKCTLDDCMLEAALADNRIPVPKKKRRQRAEVGREAYRHLSFLDRRSGINIFRFLPSFR